MAVTPRIPLRTPFFDEHGNMSRAWVLFFERFGAPGADGEPGEPAVAPENVTFVSITPTVLEDDQGNDYLHVVVEYDPPTPIGTFTGVHVKVEAPDESTITVDVGKFDYDMTLETETGSDRYGVIEMDFYPTKNEDWRFYLISYSPFVENTLILNPDPDETPNDVITVEPGETTAPVFPGDLIDISGQDFLITVEETDPNPDGLRMQRFTIVYDPPDPVPPFTGVAVDIAVPDGRVVPVGNFDYRGDPDEPYPGVARRGEFTIDVQFANTPDEDWTFYLSPYSATYRTPLDTTTTAQRTITALSDGPGPEGVEWADQVTALDVDVEYEYLKELSAWRWRLHGSWTNPDDVRFGGSNHVIRQHPAPTPVDDEDRRPANFGPAVDRYTTDWYPLAEPDTDWDNFQQSYDVLGRENSLNITNSTLPAKLCPVVRVNVSEEDAVASLGFTRGEGKEFANHVTSFSVTVVPDWNAALNRWDYYLTFAWTNPTTDPRFGGLDLIIRIAGEEDRIMPIFYEIDPGVPSGAQSFDWGKGDSWEKPATATAFSAFWRSFDWAGNANSIYTGALDATHFPTPKDDDTITTPPAVGLVTSFSIEARYGPNGALIIDPTFTPPAGDDSFYYAELWAEIGPTGGPYRWRDQLAEMGKSHDLVNLGENFPPTVPEVWKFWAVSVSYDGRKNPDPLTFPTSGSNYTTETVDPAPVLGLPTPPALPDTVTAIQFSSRQNAYTLALEAGIRTTIEYPVGCTADGVQIYLSRDNGTTWEFLSNNIAVIGGSPQVIDDWVDAPATDQTCKVKAITWNEVWNDPDVSGAGLSAISAGFVLSGSVPLAATLITNAAVALTGTGLTGNPSINIFRDDEGKPFWGFTITWTNPTHVLFRASEMTVQKYVTATGLPAADGEGVERGFAMDEHFGPGAQTHTIVHWDIPEPGHEYRIRIYCHNQLRVRTLQTGAWTQATYGFTSYLKLTPTQPTGTAGVEVAPEPTNFTAEVDPGDYTEGGTQEYRYRGTLDPPASTNYQGCTVYAAPLGQLACTNGSTTYNRVSGPFFTVEHNGQIMDVGGVTITITGWNSPTQVQGTLWTAATSTQTAVWLGEARGIDFLDRSDTNWNSDRIPVQHDSEQFRLFPLSKNAAGQENFYKAFVTPFVDVTVTRQVGGSGQVNAALVTITALTGGTGIIEFPSGIGIGQWIPDGDFAEPTVLGLPVANYGGMKVVRLSSSGPGVAPSAPGTWLELVDIPRGSGTHFRGTPQDKGSTTAYFWIALLSYDMQGRANTYVHGTTPAYQVTISPQAQSITLAYLSPGALVTASLAASITTPRIVATVSANNPPLPDPLYPAGSYLYSVSSQSLWKTTSGGMNSWIPAVGSNDLIANSVIFGKVAAAAISSVQMRAEEFLIGSDGVRPTRFRVDGGGIMQAFIGWVPAGTSVNGFTSGTDSGGVGFGQAFNGVYAYELRVGNNINRPFIYAFGTEIRMGENVATSPRVTINGAGVFFNNTPITITSGNGLTITTNSLTTYINNQAGDGGNYHALISEDGSRRISVRPGRVTMQTVAGNPLLVLAGTEGQVYVYNAAGTIAQVQIDRVSGGVIRLFDTFGNQTISMIGSTGDVSASGGAARYHCRGFSGGTGLVPVLGGNLQVVGGLVISGPGIVG